MDAVNASLGRSLRPPDGCLRARRSATVMRPLPVNEHEVVRPVASGAHRRRVALGVAWSTQTVALLLATLAVATLTGLAVLAWLEHLR